MTSQCSRKNVDPSMTDEELMELFVTTQDDFFLEQLIRRYEHDLYHYLRHFLGDAQLAEDVFQSTFFQIYLKSSQFELGRKFRPWLYMVATNQAIDLQRRNKRHQHASLEKNVQISGEELEGISLLEILPSNVPSPEELIQKEESARQIREYIDRLPEQLRTVLILIYYEGIKYREVAEILAIPVGTVKSRLHTAIKKLALMLRGIRENK
ncbi:MAG: RNA polymerase sigma factor [Thermoguttaceae bacterium]|nr:RNA polymerase sigma factor [Planctomycetaceae bacterium]MBQ4143406.1 RNA polymerase sigma factor [Thermoguttaceae bacterium]